MSKFAIRDSQVKYLKDREKRPLSEYEMVKKGYNSNLKFSRQEEMRKRAIKEFSYGGRYKDVQPVSGRRRRNYGEMGPQVYIPPQDNLRNGAMIWTRDYRTPIDADTLELTKRKSDADLGKRPAHILSIYANPTREEKRFEIYQFEDVSSKIYGKPVPAGERKKQAFSQGKAEMFSKGLKDLPVYKPKIPTSLKNSPNLEDKVKRDLYERGFTVEPGNRFGGLFIARDNLETDPDTGAKLMHSSYVVGVIPESSEVPYWALTGLTRLAKNENKTYLLGIVNEKGKVRYIQLDRLGGGRNGPRNHGLVRRRLAEAGIPFKKGFWKETNKDENLRFSVNNIYFKGPTDFHLSKEERKNRWSSVKDDKLKRGATKAIFN